ncbi:hypothetical protein THIOSC15_490005 [uncultured Thiomicrorhabdus sp.]
MSDIGHTDLTVKTITKDDGSPFATYESAKAKRTRMGKEGLDTNVVKVDGGYVLEKRPYEKPKTRIPIGRRNVLTAKKEDLDPGYVHRFVNDDPGRLRMFMDAGWEVVEKREVMKILYDDIGAGSHVGSLVTKTVGKEKTAYLMRLKREYYEEDQEAKAEKIHEHEAGLKAVNEKDGQYGEVKINRRKLR